MEHIYFVRVISLQAMSYNGLSSVKLKSVLRARQFSQDTVGIYQYKYTLQYKYCNFFLLDFNFFILS